MALTDYDKRNLSAAQQAAVEKATADWNAANARGDTAGMQAAHDAAERARNSAGYTSDSWGSYSGKVSSGTGSGGRSGGDGYSGAGYYFDSNAATRTDYSGADPTKTYDVHGNVTGDRNSGQTQQLQQQAVPNVDYQQQLAAQYQQQLEAQQSQIAAQYQQQMEAQQAQYAAQQAKSEELIKQLREQYEGAQSQYAQALAEQKAAQEAAVNKAVNGLEGQKEDVSTAYSDLYRQAYIDKMNAQKNINQRLAAQGVTGGAAESTLLGLNTSYADALRKAEQSRIGALSDLDRAITDTRLTGDIESANATASSIREQTDKNAEVLQNLINRYDTLAARAQAYDREDAQRADAYAREDAQRAEAYNRTDAANSLSWARELALQMISQGNLPDDETLSAAGMSEAQARSLLPQVATNSYTPTWSQAQVLNAAQAAAKSGEALSGSMLRDYNYYMYGDPEYSGERAASTSSAYAPSAGTSRVSYNNGGLTNAEVAQIQSAFGLDADGYWGPNSQKNTGYASAAEALNALREIAETPTAPSTGGTMTSSAALNAAVANAATVEGQILYLNQLRENGSISEAQFNDLANSLTGPRYK